jgi:hypothetical protein
MSPEPVPRIRHLHVSSYEKVLTASAEKCLERSRRLLLETSGMVDPRQSGRPLQGAKTADEASETRES